MNTWPAEEYTEKVLRFSNICQVVTSYFFFNKILEKIPKTFLKLRYLEQKYDKRKNYFLYVFPKVQYLTDFTLSVKRHVKLWSNKIKAPQNKYGRY